MRERLARFADRFTGTGTLRPQVLEALTSVRTDGVAELTSFGIAERIVELHPRRGGVAMIGQGKLSKALSQLEESGQVVHRRIGAEEAIETGTDTRYVYRLPEPTAGTPTSGQQ